MVEMHANVDLFIEPDTAARGRLGDDSAWLVLGDTYIGPKVTLHFGAATGTHDRTAVVTSLDVLIEAANDLRTRVLRSIAATAPDPQPDDDDDDDDDAKLRAVLPVSAREAATAAPHG